jgi:hypothetical protein
MLASSPLLCRCCCAWAEIFAHFVDLERGLSRVVLGHLAQQLYVFSSFQRLVLLVGEAVGLVVLLID